MSDQRIKIVSLLVERTDGGKLSWEDGFDEETFKVDIGNNTVVIAEKKKNGANTIVIGL